jgi:hypothetical protein
MRPRSSTCSQFQESQSANSFLVFDGPGRSTRSLPEGRSLALRERKRSEGTKRAVEAVMPSREPLGSRSRASESDVRRVDFADPGSS